MSNFYTDSSISQKMQALYIAYYGRAADPDGLEYWLGNINPGGKSYEWVAARIASEPEPVGRYDYLAELQAGGSPDASDREAFITEVYDNLFNREPDAVGLAHWVARAEVLEATGQAGVVIREMMDNAQNGDVEKLFNKVEVAQYYTDLVDTGALEYGEGSVSAAIIAEVDQLESSVDAAKAEIDVLAAGGELVIDVLTTDIDVSGVNLATLHAGEVIIGDSTSLNPGDYIAGDGNGTVELDFSMPYFETTSARIEDVSDIVITAKGGLELNTSRWTNIGPDTITINNSTGDVTLIDLQSTTFDADPSSAPGTTYALQDNYSSGDTVTLLFDEQAVDTKDTVVDLGVRETHVGVVMNGMSGGSIEGVALHINDVAGEESVLDDLTVNGIEELGIDGGAPGLDFEITGPLDPGLLVIDASAAESNLHLNVLESTEAMDIWLGKGDDVLNVGDTLGDRDEQDYINGGEGDDTLVADFRTVGTRNPIMENVETADFAFNDDTTVDFSEVDDLETINITPANDNGRVQLIDMDATVTAINVMSPQNPDSDRWSDWDIDYEDGEDADLTFTWTNNSASADNLDHIMFDEVEVLTVVSNGTNDIIFDEFEADDDYDNGETKTKELTFRVENTGDMSVSQYNSIQAVSDVTDMTFETTDNGNLFVASGDIFNCDDGRTIDADDLETLIVRASEKGLIAIGDIEDATQLEYISIFSAGEGIRIDEIDGRESIAGELAGATVSTFNIESYGDGPTGNVIIGSVELEDISEMNVTVHDNAFVSVDSCENFDLQRPGDTLTVQGTGTFAGLNFAQQAFHVMDFSGLSNDNGDVNYSNSNHVVKYIGTEQNDNVFAGTGAQNIETYGGRDNVNFNNNNTATNYINTGDGVDRVNLSNADGSVDVVNVGGTEVNDVILPDGGISPRQIDMIDDFDSRDDALEWGIKGNASNYLEVDGNPLFGGVDSFAEALTLADTEMNAQGLTYFFVYDIRSGNYADDGLLFKDTNADGHADQVIHFEGAQTANFLDGGDIIDIA